MPLRLVLDTNVVLDLLHFADPAAQPILAALETGGAICWVDEAGLAELTRVLTYPELKLSTESAIALLARYRQLARQAAPGLAPGVGLPACRDRDDQKFLELASQVGADILVSRDKALLRLCGARGLRFRILTPSKIQLSSGTAGRQVAAL